MKEFLLRLLQQIAWALGAFCAFALGFEWLIPNSVTPYVHLVPIVIVAAMLLCCDAIFFHPKETIVERIWIFAFPVVLTCSMYLTYRGPRMTNLLALSLIAAMMFGSAGLVFLYKRED